MADTPNPNPYYPHNTGAYPTAPVIHGNTSQAFAIPVGYMQPPPPPLPPAPPPPTQSTLLAAWWKQLVAFCAGLTAFGVVAYAVASQFFLPREDFGAFSDTLKKVEAKMETIHTSMDEMQTSLQANTKAVQRFDRIVAAEGLSEDAAIESRRKQRAAKRAGQ